MHHGKDEKIDMSKEYGNEFISEQEARETGELFSKCLKSYKEKRSEAGDQEWLEGFLQTENPGRDTEEIRRDSEEILRAIRVFDENLSSCTEASRKGVSKEKWLAEKMQEASVGMAVEEFGRDLQQLDEALSAKNLELAEALSRSSDGHIMMSPNLDGNIAENMIAKTAELSAAVQGKNITVEVLESHAANSVDVRAINHDTGQYQNYQLKFGKDAKATIDLLERGNYNNQRVIVPSEQLEEVREYFREKGSSKTITDHIDAWGAEGKSFTKEEMKALQEKAQKEGAVPELDYSHYQTEEMAFRIGKNVGKMALMSAAVTTGLNVAKAVFSGEKINGEELVEAAIKTGADTSVKTVVSGALEAAIRRRIFKYILKNTPVCVIAGIAWVAVENVKVFSKVASGEMTLTRGIDQMGRV
ncbi:MAG: hypothetical protein IJU50_09935, partial [Lachnospiraceae bacterium]|nr:hypothetical protein [Lachnospiraceae bacterium]